MRFSNMLACAAVLGYTTAVQIEGENTLDTSAFRWQLSSDAVTLINLVDNQNSIGLKGALEECNRKKGSLQICGSLERDADMYRGLEDEMSYAVDEAIREYQESISHKYNRFT